jgi:hypothetical protein
LEGANAVKIAVFLWSLFMALQACLGADPSGEFVELHSCDLYTGGCTASSQSTLLGRQLLRIWSIKQGTWNNRDLANLKAAVLELGSANLAENGAVADNAEIFVPKGLPAAQKEALLSWVNSQAPIPASVRVVEAEIIYQRLGSVVKVAVNDSISLSTMAIAKCDSGACGQALWYEPQAEYSEFEVIASQSSNVRDAALNFSWTDHNRPNVFLASFGPNGSALDDLTCR